MKLCDALLQRLSLAVKQLQHLQIDRQDNASVDEFEVTEKCEDLQRLAMCLDAMFMNGLRSAAKGYFKFVRYFTHKDVLYDLDHRMFRVSTEIGLGRAWLYRALSENLLECYLQNMTADQGRLHVLKFYYKEALLSDQASLQVALMTIAGLENIRINLTWDLPFLDVSACDIALKIRSESEITTDRESSRGSVDGGRGMGSRTSSLLGEEIPSSMTLPLSLVESLIASNVADIQDSTVVTENFLPENDELHDEIVVSRKFSKRKKLQRSFSNNDPTIIGRETFNSYYSLAGDNSTFDNTSIMSANSEKCEFNSLIEIEESAQPSTIIAGVTGDVFDCNNSKSADTMVEPTNVLPAMLPSIKANESSVYNSDNIMELDLAHLSLDTAEKEGKETSRPASYSIYSISNNRDDNYTNEFDSFDSISCVPDPTMITDNVEELKDQSINYKCSTYFEDSCKYALEEESMSLELDIDNNTKLELLLNVFGSDSETLLGMFRVLVSSSFICQATTDAVHSAVAKSTTLIPRTHLLRSLSSCMSESQVNEDARQDASSFEDGGSRLRLSSLLLAITTKYLHLVRHCALTERFSRLVSLPVASIEHVCVSLRSLGIYVHLRAPQPRCHLWLGEPRLVENLVTHLYQLHNGSISILRDATYQRLTLLKWINTENALRGLGAEALSSTPQQPWLHYCMLAWEVCSSEESPAADKSTRSTCWSGAGDAELSGVLSWRSTSNQAPTALAARSGSFVGLLASSFSRYGTSHESQFATNDFDVGYFRLRGRVLARYALDLVSTQPSEVEQRWLLSSETCSSCRMVRDEDDKTGRTAVLQIRMKDCAGGHCVQLTGKNIDKWLIACCAAVALCEPTDHNSSMLAQPLFSAVLTPTLLLLGVESIEECRVFTAAVTLVCEIASLSVDTEQPNYLRLNFFESHVDYPWLLYFASIAERNAFARALSDVWLQLCQVPIQVCPLDVNLQHETRYRSLSGSRDSPADTASTTSSGPLRTYRASAKAVERVFRQTL